MKIVNIEKVKYSTTGRYISSFPPHLLDIFKFCVCHFYTALEFEVPCTVLALLD